MQGRINFRPVQLSRTRLQEVQHFFFFYKFISFCFVYSFKLLPEVSITDPSLRLPEVWKGLFLPGEERQRAIKQIPTLTASLYSWNDLVEYMKLFKLIVLWSFTKCRKYFLAGRGGWYLCSLLRKSMLWSVLWGEGTYVATIRLSHMKSYHLPLFTPEMTVLHGSISYIF